MMGPFARALLPKTWAEKYSDNVRQEAKAETREAIGDLIDAADILVHRRDYVGKYVALIPSKSVERLERALEQAQKAVKESRPVIRDTRVVEVRGLCEELEELKCIASEMAKALRAVRDMHRAHCLIEPEQPCATCTDEWLCPGRVADKARREWEQWEEGQS